MTKLSVEGFQNFFKYYTDEPHQKAAVEELYNNIDADLLEESADWIKEYRTPSELPTLDLQVANPLPVPYQYQLDNASGTGYRECFSSSCAMVAMYYGKVRNDDHYNEIRSKYGDSTDAQAQIRALRSLGLEANFITNASRKELQRQIDIGRPTPCGWLHKGSVTYPTGGGHYSVVIGYGKDYWVHHDPNGEANLVAGGYVTNAANSGSSVKYSAKNWEPRWLVEGNGTGWMMDIYDPKNAKQPVVAGDTKVTSPDGISLIKEFEGCELKSYPDPGTGGAPWTIAFGHTGPEVVPGMTISQPEADQLLIQDLHRFEQAVTRLIEVPLTQHEFDAAVSFSYNVGEGALSSSTFRRRLNDGEDKPTVYSEELPRWVNGPDGPMPGLVRRRDAEVALALTP